MKDRKSILPFSANFNKILEVWSGRTENGEIIIKARKLFKFIQIITLIKKIIRITKFILISIALSNQPFLFSMLSSVLNMHSWALGMGLVREQTLELLPLSPPHTTHTSASVYLYVQKFLCHNRGRMGKV